MEKGALRGLLNELEFGSVIRELGLAEAQGEAASYGNVRWEDMFYGGAVGYALSSVSAMDAELLDMAVAAAGGVAVARGEADQGELFESTFTLDAADAKALAVYARKKGYTLRPGDDPLLMAYVLDPNTATPEAVARRYGVGEWGADARSRAVVTAELLKVLPEEAGGAAARALRTASKNPLPRCSSRWSTSASRLTRTF